MKFIANSESERRVFDEAVIGWTSIKPGGKRLAVYSYDKCVFSLMSGEGMSYESAVEWVEFNIVPHCEGDDAPLLVRSATKAGLEYLVDSDVVR
mgnify:CR=1 FL=1|tara:strand:- start:101 stop:382 length:282 start_codon:yes stop_codon:yes gene_type:complete